MRRVLLVGLPWGAIVRVNGRWGVLCQAYGKVPRGYRVVDFWDGGREAVSVRTVVEM